MDDTIFKPLTHMDREGRDENLTSRFQRRDTTPLNDTAFENMDTNPTTPQEGWEPDGEVEQGLDQNPDIEASGCWCPDEDQQVDNVVYQETVIVEFYDDDEK